MDRRRIDPQDPNYAGSNLNRNPNRGAVPPRTSEPSKHVAQRMPGERGSSVPPRQPVRQSTGQAGSPRRSSADPRAAKRAAQNRKTMIIALSAVAAVLLIAVIAVCSALFAAPVDDGLILNNVYAAGINLGGMTPEQAKEALREATADTYSKLDMVVSVHDTELHFTPAKTGARPNLSAIVDAAYSYGRTGTRSERQNAKKQSLTSSHVISILPYLNLNTDFIKDAVDDLGETYSSTLSQPSYRIEGNLPDVNMPTENIDTETVYQTLYIKLGTAEFGLDTEKLYEQIMEAYNTNIFYVAGNISVVSPELLNLQALYDEYCIPPVDAVLNEITYEVTAETYGYGFRMEEVRAMIENAKYGDEIIVPLKFLRPALTAAELTDGLFEKELAFFSTPASIDKNLIINLKLACRAINNTILKADEIFSFNEIVGQPTTADKYQEVVIYVGKQPQPVVGGGISQVSSALYYCALQADLEILERHNHIYAPSYILEGLDANVSYGTMDFSFKNTTGRPIRIEARVTDAGALQISIWGTENDAYTVDILCETLATYSPETLKHTMLGNNPEGYLDGDILVQPIIGYDVCTYRVYGYADESMAQVKKLIAFSHYDKLDKLVVEIETAPENPPELPSDPTGPSVPTEPSNPTEPSDPAL